MHTLTGIVLAVITFITTALLLYLAVRARDHFKGDDSVGY